MSKFVTRKSIEVKDLSGCQYSVNKNIRFKTPMLRSGLCDYSDAYIVVKETITVEGNSTNNLEDKKVTFKNNSPFRSWISKINNTFAGNAEDLDIVMPMYNLLEYSDNYSMTSGSLWNYYRDEVNDNANKINDDIYKTNNNRTRARISFDYKTNIIGVTPDNINESNTEVVVILKYLNNFWISLDLPLINCEIGLDLSWLKGCIISQRITPDDIDNPNANPPNPCTRSKSTSDAIFQINSTKLYVQA